MIGHAWWAARMGWHVSALYRDAVRETWRRQFAAVDHTVDWLFLYALRDTWERTHVSHPPSNGTM